MSYSLDVDLAEEICLKAHMGAVDKAGEPYSLHPIRVAGRMDSPEGRVVGLLHDVVEDTDVTLEDIERMFGKETAEAVDAITHRKGESWSDYLCRVKANPMARDVKISDLIDNSNLSRLPDIRPKDVERAEKYLRALRFLLEIDGE